MSFLDLSLRVRHALARGVLSLGLFFGLAASCAPDGGDGDGGATDAATDERDAGDDAGDDAGVDPCEGLDPVLGSLTLADGYSIVDSAPLPAGIGALRVVEEGAGRRLFGVDVAADAVVDLGLWPDLAATPTKLFDVLPPDLDDEGAMVSWFLAYDGTRLATGYTGSFDTETFVAPGAIALYDLTPGAADPLTFVDAANNYAAEFVGDTLALNASSLGALDEGTAIYALADAPRVLARYEDPTSTFGGPMVATKDGGLVVGGYVSATGQQHFFTLSADDVDAALAGEPVALADAEAVLAAPALAAARFGDDLAYVHGDFFNPLEGVRRVSLGAGAERTPTDVLTPWAADCSTVDLLAPLDDDLLVSVDDDEGGLRLLRIREDG